MVFYFIVYLFDIKNLQLVTIDKWITLKPMSVKFKLNQSNYYKLTINIPIMKHWIIIANNFNL